MNYYVGIDVLLDSPSVCVVDESGQIIWKAKVGSEPIAFLARLRSLEFDLTRIGLEADPLSQWLYAGMRDAGLTVELLETRHVRDAFKAMPVKTDRKNARGIAQLMRLGRMSCSATSRRIAASWRPRWAQWMQGPMYPGRHGCMRR